MFNTRSYNCNRYNNCEKKEICNSNCYPYPPQCIEGPPGPRGDTGSRGEKGDRGDPGCPGPRGLQGIKGEIGNTGPQGIRGDRGPKGDQGDPGPMGPRGLRGPAGPQGPQGAIGPQGDIGPRGPRGEMGIPGPPGEQGSIGPQGPMGLQGMAGVTGPEGPEGPRGCPGPEGQEGPMGPPGLTGITGPKGEPGECGTGLVAFGGLYNDKFVCISIDKNETKQIPLPDRMMFHKVNHLSDNIITVQENGIYDLEYSLVYTVRQAADITVCIRRNGANVPETISKCVLEGEQTIRTHGASFVQLFSGDRIELTVSATEEVSLVLEYGCSAYLRLKKLD